jgi:hypothetical protein
MNGNRHIETPRVAPDGGAGFHPSALHPPPDPRTGAGDASEITLECIGRPAPRTASTPTMRFGYHPHAVRVRLDKVAAGMKSFPVTTTGAGGLPLQPSHILSHAETDQGMYGMVTALVVQ